MRIFPPETEEAAFRHGRLREWAREGLLAPEAAAAAAAAAGPEPHRAAWPMRLALFGFSCLCCAAAYFFLVKDVGSRGARDAAALAVAAACAALAEAAIRRLKPYRGGAEEALVFMAGVFLFVGLGSAHPRSLSVNSAALAVFSLLVSRRYGYVLAPVSAAVWAGVLVGSLEWGERATRVGAAGLYAALLPLASSRRGVPRREEDGLELLRFFLALTIPLCLNVRLGSLLGRPVGMAAGAFAWATFAAVFLIPAAFLRWGAALRARSLLWAGGIGLLVAVCSIKPYLGLERRSWDPAVLGLGLIAAALLLKRRLDSGPGGRRGAFSSEGAAGGDHGGALGLLAGVAAVHGPPGAPPPDAPRGGGGGFGGGGASGSY